MIEQRQMPCPELVEGTMAALRKNNSKIKRRFFVLATDYYFIKIFTSVKF
jgi:hypothetical protein